MKLALRRDPPTNANIWQRFSCWVIKTRLVSQYCHGGIVIDGHLYHATAQRGLHVLAPGDWTPDRWDIFDIGGDDEWALSEFRRLEGARYDWLSLLAFVGVRARDSAAMYCYEWNWLAIMKENPKIRVTPEMLLAAFR